MPFLSYFGGALFLFGLLHGCDGSKPGSGVPGAQSSASHSTLSGDSTPTPTPTATPTPTPAPLACDPNLHGIASQFNAVIFENFVAPSSDIDGRLAVGQNVQVSHYSVGAGLTMDPTRFDLIAGGNIDFNQGSVPNGNIMYGGTLSLTSASSAGTPVHATDGLVSAVQLQAQQVSQAIAAATPNQTPVISYSGSRAFVTLNATVNGGNVFQMSVTDLANTHTMTINGSSAATVIVNVSGGSIAAEVKEFAMTLSGGIPKERILFNFPTATTLSIHDIDFKAMILAPLADVSFPTGLLTGQLIAKSMNGAGQLNQNYFNGCLPVVATTQYAKDSFQDGVDLSVVGGGVSELYGTSVMQFGEYVVVAMNANLPIGGTTEAGVTYGWGDYLMNFTANQSQFPSSADPKVFGVRFATANGSGASSVGLYRGVASKAVELSYSGWAPYSDYTDFVQNHGGILDSIGSYFVPTAGVPNEIDTGTLVVDGNVIVLSAMDIQALGFDFPGAFGVPSSQLGSETLGFVFKRPSDMTGSFVGHVSPECGNDVMSISGVLH